MALREDLHDRANNASAPVGLNDSLLIEAGHRQSADRVCRIVELVAEGGAGKTSLEGARRSGASPKRGIKSMGLELFEWSFYSQGTRVFEANVNIHAGEMEAAGMMAAAE